MAVVFTFGGLAFIRTRWLTVTRSRTMSKIYAFFAIPMPSARTSHVNVKVSFFSNFQLYTCFRSICWRRSHLSIMPSWLHWRWTDLCRCWRVFRKKSLHSFSLRVLLATFSDNTHNCAAGYRCGNTDGSFTCTDIDECSGELCEQNSKIEKKFDELEKKTHTIVMPTIPVRIPMEPSTATKIGHGFQTFNSLLGLVKPWTEWCSDNSWARGVQLYYQCRGKSKNKLWVHLCRVRWWPYWRDGF